MGNFDEHIEYGLLGSFVMIFVLIAAGYISNMPFQIVTIFLPLVFGITVIGSLLPDIDHHNSYPFQILLRLVPMAVTVSILFVYFYIHTTVFSIVTEYIIIPEFVFVLFVFTLSLGIFMCIRALLKMFRPKHRGITHQLEFAIVLSVLFGVFVYQILQFQAFQFTEQIFGASVLSFALLIGIGSHLYCDEMIRSQLPV